MSCEGAKARRDGLIADMVKLRESIQGSAIGTHLLPYLADEPQAALTMTLGYLSVVLDGLCAAVIALAGPCCDDCDEKPPQSSIPPHEPREDNSPWRAG